MLFWPPSASDKQAIKEEVTADTHIRKKGGRRKASKGLPRVHVEHDLPDAERYCTCGACLERIGEKASEHYNIIPPVFHVLEHVRFKCACPACDA